MEPLIVYYNPRCNKCRMAADSLRQRDIEFKIIEYLKGTP